MPNATRIVGQANFGDYVEPTPEGAVYVVQTGAALSGGGRYRYSVVSGLFSGLASNAPLFAFRWAQTGKLCVIESLRARWQTVAGFTAAQEIYADLVKVTNYTAPHAGGTGGNLAAGELGKLRATHAISDVSDVRIAASAALTAPGGVTLGISPLVSNGAFELATGATIPRSGFTLDLPECELSPIVLTASEGIVLRSLIGMGAGGTARLHVDLLWREVPFYPQ